MLYRDPNVDHFETWCPHCRYPMLQLRGFEGISSATNTDLQPEKVNPFILWYLFAEIWSSFKTLKRQRRARQLQKEILPQYPFTLICPQCFHLELRR